MFKRWKFADAFIENNFDHQCGINVEISFGCPRKNQRFRPEPKYSLYFGTFIFILQFNIHFTQQTSYFQQISQNICSWNYQVMASTKQKGDVTIQIKRCILDLYSASVILPTCLLIPLLPVSGILQDLESVRFKLL